MSVSRRCLAIAAGALVAVCGWGALAIASTTAAQPTRADTAARLAEVNRKFTIAGHPIHPKLIYRFLPWMSDSVPTVLSVDVSASDGSNEYDLADVETSPDGTLRVANKKTGDPAEEGFFDYKWMGSPVTGVHALLASYSGGGSGVFMTLMVVKVSLSTGVGPDGKAYDRLVLSIDREIELGDRWSGSLKVEPGRIMIGPTVSTPTPRVLAYK